MRFNEVDFSVKSLLNFFPIRSVGKFRPKSNFERRSIRERIATIENKDLEDNFNTLKAKPLTTNTIKKDVRLNNSSS